MDELILQGKKYISSKRGAELTGYAKDYIGQLARGGKIPATQVGRTWYVLEEALIRHKTGAEEQQTPRMAQAAVQGYKRPILYHPHQISDIPKTWSRTKYFDDQGALMPPLKDQSLSDTAEIHIVKDHLENEDNLVIHRDEPALKGPRKITTTQAPVMDTRLNEMRSHGEITLDLREKRKEPEKPKVRQKIIPPFFSINTTATAGLATLLLLFIPLLGSLVGFETEYSGATETQTASVSLGLEYLAVFIEGVFDIVKGFFENIFSSFSVFFRSGIDFIIDLPSRLGEIFNFVLGK